MSTIQESSREGFSSTLLFLLFLRLHREEVPSLMVTTLMAVGGEITRREEAISCRANQTPCSFSPLRTFHLKNYPTFLPPSPSLLSFLMERPPILLLLLLVLYFLHGASSNPCNSIDLTSLESFARGLTSEEIPTWKFDASSSTNSTTSCCLWKGVTCDNSSTSRVIKLKLPNMALTGSIANDSLSSLDHLLELDLFNNSLTGNVPHKLFTLPKLVSLNLSMNNLNGNIARETSLPSITNLDLSFNRFSGHIPHSLFGSTSLINLCLQSNQFSGTLPTQIGDLTNLVQLDISSNNLSAPIPDVFHRLNSLRYLSLSSNSFEGNLPSSFSSLQSIQVLNLNNNSLVGSIDLDFSHMPSLTSIDLGSNLLNGTIPSSLSSCRTLKTINLARNKLAGEIPKSFEKLKNLNFLSLSNNSLENFTSAMETLQNCSALTTLVVTINFKGDLLPGDDSITGFDSLQLLVAANCELSGSIPRWLSRCPKLQLLDLSWNKLHGRIPTWFGELTSLFYLDLSNNTLSGEIPWSSFANITALTSANTSERGSSSANLPFFSKQGDRVVALQYNHLRSFPPTLDLSDNSFNGTISPEIGELRKIHILDLSNNSFEDSIPPELSKLRSLEHLDLSLNGLSGRIPNSLTNLSFLSKLNVSHNNLSGRIPTNRQFSTFKPSSYVGNAGLCGEPLDDCGGPLESNPSTNRSGRGKNRAAVVGKALGIAFGVFLLLLLLLHFFVLSRTRSRRVEDAERESSSGNGNEINSGSGVVLLFETKEPESMISIDDILESTGNFDQANIIGCGGFGLVYKATLPDGVRVAIKRLSGEFGQVEREFQAEVEALSRAQHRHLVPLRGYCKIGRDRVLIYSYMENGSLDCWLHERNDGTTTLDWKTRLAIARGAAKGLAHLHDSCNILHRDVKSSNILLDSNFQAHLADFGLARLMLPWDTHVSTDLVGTLGYIPPEYAQSPVATMKGDVYSFGVVLLELLTGRRPMDMCGSKETRDLIKWVVKMREEGKESEVFDGDVSDQRWECQMVRVLELACNCLKERPKERPLIKQVVSWLDDLENFAQID